MAKEWLYLIKHPADTIKTIVLRKETQILDDFAPTNYLGMPFVDAVKAFRRHKQSRTSSNGVRLTDWPVQTQKDNDKGTNCSSRR